MFLVSLEVFNDVEKLPPALMEQIKAEQCVLRDKWRELNNDV